MQYRLIAIKYNLKKIHLKIQTKNDFGKQEIYNIQFIDVSPSFIAFLKTSSFHTVAIRNKEYVYMATMTAIVMSYDSSIVNKNCNVDRIRKTQF